MRSSSHVSSYSHPGSRWWREWAQMIRLSPYLEGKKSMMGWIVVCSVAVISTQLAVPLVMKAVVDEGIMAADRRMLVFLAVLFLVITVIATVIRSVQAILTTILIQHVIKNFRSHLISHLLWQKPAYHDSETSGNLLTRATNDFDSITEYLNHGVLKAMVDVFVVVGSLCALFFLHPILLVIGLVAFVICVYGIRWVSLRTRRQTQVAKRELSKLNAHSQECLYQHMAIKLYGGESTHFNTHHILNRQFRLAQVKAVGYDAFLYSLIDALTACTIGVCFWFLATETLGFDHLSPGMMVAFVRVIQQIFDPLKDLGSTISMLQGLFVNFDRIFELLGIQQRIEGSASLPISRDRSICFQHVYFTYSSSSPSATSWVLKDISLNVPAGSSAAIVGETGSGKSTLAKILAKIYDGYEGSISIGTTELRDIDPKNIRRHVALVSQDLTLFAGTMEWNIHLGRPSLGRKEAIHAAKICGAHEFISSWKNGYDERVLESGINLSHGQKQLISLCRALCYDPEILILDEATSAIDPVTEEALRTVFQDVIQNKTRIIIAHKLATIKDCDQIFVMDQGRIVETGSHEDLMAQKSYYYRMIQARQTLENTTGVTQ